MAKLGVRPITGGGIIPNLVIDEQQNVFVNQQLRYIRGFILVPSSDRFPVVTPASSSGAPVPMIAPQEAAGKILTLNGFHAAGDNADVKARLQVEITDTKFRRTMMNRPILVNHVFGDNLQQARLPMPILFNASQAFQLRFTNGSSAGESNYYPSFKGFKIQDTEVSREDLDALLDKNEPMANFAYPFWGTLDDGFATLAASGRATKFFSLTSEMTFVIYSMMASAISTGASGDTQELFTAEIYDPDDDVPLQSAPVTFNTGFGTAKFPYELPAPIIMGPNRKMRVDLVNLVTDQPTDVFLTFFGVAYYHGERLAQVQNQGQVRRAPFLYQEEN